MDVAFNLSLSYTSVGLRRVKRQYRTKCTVYTSVVSLSRFEQLSCVWGGAVVRPRLSSNVTY